MTFTVRFGVTNRVVGDSDEWGVSTVKGVINHPRAKSALGYPDNSMVFIDDELVNDDRALTNGCVIRVQKVANTKGA